MNCESKLRNLFLKRHTWNKEGSKRCERGAEQRYGKSQQQQKIRTETPGTKSFLSQIKKYSGKPF
jgi:hypothetical protein